MENNDSSAQGGDSGTQSGPADPSPFSRLRRMFSRSVGPPPVTTSDSPADIAAATQGAREMLVNVRNMRDKRIEDVSVPRADIIALGDTTTIEETVDAFQTSTYSRLPIYTETLDNPIGFVHLKDVALRYGFVPNAEEVFDIKTQMRPLLYVPPSMSVAVLLQKMQTARIHMALVIDEYGGTDGLVTIEDLIEQVVGEIEDEHDIEETKSWVLERPGIYLAQARTELADFEEEIGIKLTASAEIDDEEIETLGGLVTLLAGHLPARGEVITHPDGPEFEVIDADPRLIKRLRVCLPSAKHG